MSSVLSGNKSVEKGVVIFLTFNIDLAEKNPQYKVNESDTSAKADISTDNSKDSKAKTNIGHNSGAGKVSVAMNPQESNTERQVDEAPNPPENNDITKKTETSTDEYRPDEGYKLAPGLSLP